jgi:superfamily I DNA/RNA helicase
MMPDIRFQIAGPDIETRLVYDERDEAGPINDYIDRLAVYWTSDRRVGDKALIAAEAKALVDLIRGDFDLRPSLKARIARVNSELLKLTEEEFRVLDGLAENDRAIISGGAGTGKTLLAVEEAIRLEKQGARVLLCCYNRQLAKFLERVVAEKAGITATTLHSVMREIILRDGRHPDLLDHHDDTTFRVKYPAAVIDALVNVRETAQFDVLIVDEGQDLLSGAYLDVMDLLLIGGWTSGRWRVFLDQKQNMYLPDRAIELDRIKTCAHVSYRLTINCRNTRGVAIQTSLLSMIDSDVVLRVDGPTPKLIWYRDRNDQQRQVTNEVNRLLSEGIEPAQIVLLSDMRFENSLVSAGLPSVRCGVDDLAKPTKQSGSIGFSTIHAFKGLEEDAVVLLDTDDIASPEARTNLYVGSSRARAYLTVCLDERVRADYERQAEDFGRRLGGRL